MSFYEIVFGGGYPVQVVIVEAATVEEAQAAARAAMPAGDRQSACDPPIVAAEEITLPHYMEME